MLTTQSALTIVAPVSPGHEAELQAVLESAGQDPADNPVLPFGQFPNVHFGRFFILPSATDPRSRAYSAHSSFSPTWTDPPTPSSCSWSALRARVSTPCTCTARTTLVAPDCATTCAAMP